MSAPSPNPPPKKAGDFDSAVESAGLAAAIGGAAIFGLTLVAHYVRADTSVTPPRPWIPIKVLEHVLVPAYLGITVGLVLLTAGLTAMRWNLAGSRQRQLLLAATSAAMVCAAVSGVYAHGPKSLLVSATLASALVYVITSPRDPRQAREVEAFRLLPTRQDLLIEREQSATGYRGDADDHAEPELPYRQLFLEAEKAAVKRRLKPVEALPPELSKILAQIATGRPVAFHQLRSGIGYVAFVEAGHDSISDFVTVLMQLEDKAPSFVARPLPIVEGKLAPNTGVRFKDDPEFTRTYLVEPNKGADPKTIRAFLNETLRDELFEAPNLWLYVGGYTMALTRFGRFDADDTDALVEIADVFFAELGADGGPSLLEPDGVLRSGPKVAAKKKKRGGAGAAPAAEA